MARLLYTLLLALLLPLVVIWMKWRGWRNPAHRGSLRQRMAIGLQQRQDRPLWLHAASVGEVQALVGLVRLLLRETPAQPLLITVGSPTGVTRAEALFAQEMQALPGEAQRVTVLLAPFDFPGVARRFLAAVGPRSGAFVETEIWPNMIAVATRHGVPLSMVSARVSERSTISYLRYASGLVRRTLVKFRGIGAQSEADRQRFIRLGADPSRLQVIGNLKFDFPLPVDIEQQGRKLRARHAPHRPMWVAGSTHAGEEEICIAAQQVLLDRATAAGNALPLLVLAPRRAERFDEVADWLAGRGVRFVRSSAAASSTPGGAHAAAEVVLVDTLGELLGFYAASDVAFVGGSLVPVGGHNLLEPAALGKPTLTGPHSFNSPEAARLLEKAHALLRVTDVTLADTVHKLLSDPVAAAAQGQRAAAAVVANQGAAARALQMITRSWT
jgi:3-deoxy-D-manno-octulosonic-acid transferase